MDGLMEQPYLAQQPHSHSHKGRKGEGEGEGADWLIERKAAAAASDRKERQKLERSCDSRCVVCA